MDDAMRVRRVERIDDLPRNRQRIVGGDGAACDAFGKRGALDEFEDERRRLASIFDAVDGRDVRVVECGKHLGFASEAGEPIGVVRERRRQQLQCDVAPEPPVVGAMDLAHPAGAKHAEHFIGSDGRPRRQCHRDCP